jgi:hypothetical protein
MKKNIKAADLIDIQIMSHNNFDEPLKQKEAADLLRDNNIAFYPSITGNCHDIAILKKDLLKVKTICGYFLLDDESNEITLSEIRKYLDPEPDSIFN